MTFDLVLDNFGSGNQVTNPEGKLVAGSSIDIKLGCADPSCTAWAGVEQATSGVTNGNIFEVLSTHSSSGWIPNTGIQGGDDIGVSIESYPAAGTAHVSLTFNSDLYYSGKTNGGTSHCDAAEDCEYTVLGTVVATVVNDPISYTSAPTLMVASSANAAVLTDSRCYGNDGSNKWSFEGRSNAEFQAPSPPAAPSPSIPPLAPAPPGSTIAYVEETTSTFGIVLTGDYSAMDQTAKDTLIQSLVDFYTNEVCAGQPASECSVSVTLSAAVARRTLRARRSLSTTAGIAAEVQAKATSDAAKAQLVAKTVSNTAPAPSQEATGNRAVTLAPQAATIETETKAVQKVIVSTATGDVHVHHAGGGGTDIRGYDNAVFNLVSTTSTSLNARFTYANFTLSPVCFA